MLLYNVLSMLYLIEMIFTTKSLNTDLIDCLVITVAVILITMVTIIILGKMKTH